MERSDSCRTFYLYDGDEPICEMDGSGNLTAVNDFGPDGVWARHGLTDEWFYTLDPQGCLSEKVGLSGAVRGASIFDAGGGEITTSAADPFNGMAGQWGCYADWETSPDGGSCLALMTHRFYDPTTGRFVNRDPLGYAGGVNLYAYTQNNPVNRADPTGLHDFEGLPDGAGTNVTTIPGTVPPSVVDNIQAEENAEDCGAGDVMGGGGTGPSAVPPENRIVLGLREDLENFRQFIGGTSWKQGGLTGNGFGASGNNFTEAINNPWNEIHFNLTGPKEGGPPLDPISAANQGSLGRLDVPNNITNWELFSLRENQEALSRSTFWQKSGGTYGRVQNPF